jgi:hypothetical protein
MEGLPTSSEPPPSPWECPPLLLKLAARNTIDSALARLRLATWEQFPSAEAVSVMRHPFFDADYEPWIVFEVRIAKTEVPDPFLANLFWEDGVYRVCPAPLVPFFSLQLVLTE